MRCVVWWFREVCPSSRVAFDAVALVERCGLTSIIAGFTWCEKFMVAPGSKCEQEG